MDFVFIIMNFVLNMMIYMQTPRGSLYLVIAWGGFFFFVIGFAKNDEFCIKHDEICIIIKNGDFSKMGRQVHGHGDQ